MLACDNVLYYNYVYIFMIIRGTKCKASHSKKQAHTGTTKKYATTCMANRKKSQKRITPSPESSSESGSSEHSMSSDSDESTSPYQRIVNAKRVEVKRALNEIMKSVSGM